MYLYMRSSSSSTMSLPEMDDGKQVLPGDVIRSILIRLPVRSLIRFQSVCKEWKNLFRTQSFIAEHLQHSSDQNPFLFFEDIGTYEPYSACLLDRDMRVFEFPIDPIFDYVRCVSIISFCNGLVCLKLSSVPSSLILIVWNPATRKMRLVSDPVEFCVDGSFHLGFGFSPTVDDYKIVKIRDFENENEYLINQVEVYSLSTGTWKQVEFGQLDGVAIFYNNGFNFNGTIFWIGSKLGTNEDEQSITIIISFDLATETFTLIQMPPLLRSVIDMSYAKNLTVYEKKLAMLSHSLSEDLKSSFIHLWVMEVEKGTGASRERWCWVKKFTSRPFQGFKLGYMLQPVTIWRNEIVCNVSDDKFEDDTEPNSERKIVMFNYKTNEFKIIDIRKKMFGYCLFNFAESLVPVGAMHVE